MRKLAGLLLLIIFTACEKNDAPKEPEENWNTLTVSPARINFPEAGGTQDFTLETDAGSWAVALSEDAGWIQLSQDTGTTATATISVTTTANKTTTSRSVSLTVRAGDADHVNVLISQAGALFPDYNISPQEPDATGMEHTAMELAGLMTVGWNCGNTLEAIGGETNWGNPEITAGLIQLVKENGFSAVRLPCSWDQYAYDETAEIDAGWLNRVKEVVQLCIDEELYVVLNIHWDGGWLENHVTPEKQVENNAKQKAFWQQIATHLRDFDEHLLFAGANEPNVENTEQMDVLMSYHQTFIDAVRSTGGRNSYRVLVVQGPSTDIEKTFNLMDGMPADEVPDRLMAEIHYYTPYQFCLMTEDASWGDMFFYWGADYHSESDPGRNATWGEEATLDELMGRMKTQFVDEGIPVIMGEYAAIRRSSLTGEDLDLHLASRAHFLNYSTSGAIANGLIPFYWDAGNMGNNASALFNRQNNTIYDQQALDAIMEGANQ